MAASSSAASSGLASSFLALPPSETTIDEPSCDVASRNAPHGDDDVLAPLLGVAAIAPGVRRVAWNEETNGARGELRRGHAVALHRDEHAAAEREPSPLDALGTHRLLERGVVDLGGRPVRGNARGRGRRCAVELRRVPRLVREGDGDAVTALLPARALARRRRVPERLARDEPRDDAVGERAHDRSVLELLELGPDALGDLALSALDVSERRQRSDGLGREREQVLPAHARTFSAMNPTSWPGVIAPTWAPTFTRLRAMSLS